MPFREANLKALGEIGSNARLMTRCVVGDLKTAGVIYHKTGRSRGVAEVVFARRADAREADRQKQISAVQFPTLSVIFRICRRL